MRDLPSCGWTERTPIEDSQSFNNAADLVLGASLHDPEQRRQFSRPITTGRAENWRLREVTFFPAFSLLFKENEVIEATRYGGAPNEEDLARKYLAGHHRHLEGRRFFIGLNRYCLNYYHILTQIIPAVAGYELISEFRDGVLLIGSPPPVLLRGLELAGIQCQETIDLEAGTPLDIDDLTFSSFLCGSNPLSPFSLSVFDRMIEHTKAPDPKNFCDRRIIYVWRADSVGRPMRNEDELVDRLIRNFGVDPVMLSLLSLDEQIALFRNARLVIGPHGAGLANIVFCSPGAVLYELLPSHYINSGPNHLAQLRGVHYWCDVHKAEAKPGLWRHQTPWVVDIASVEARLQEIISSYDIPMRGQPV
jgi:hypothetical protein